MLNTSFPNLRDVGILKDKRRPVDILLSSDNPVPTNIRTLIDPTQGLGKQPPTFGKGNVTIEFTPSYDGKVKFGTEHAPLIPLQAYDSSTQSHWISLTDSLGEKLGIVEHVLAIVSASRIAFDMRFYGTPTAPTLANCIHDYVTRILPENLRDTPWNIQYATVEKPVLFQEGDSYMLIEPYNQENPQLTLDISVDYPTPGMAQRIVADANDELLLKIASARTGAFGFREKLLRLGEFPGMRQTLLRKYRQFSLKNVMAHSKQGIRNPNPDFTIQSSATGKNVNSELIYHELIDRFGAIALLHPHHLLGRVTSHRTGHRFDVEAMKMLINNSLLKKIGSSE